MLQLKMTLPGWAVLAFLSLVAKGAKRLNFAPRWLRDYEADRYSSY